MITLLLLAARAQSVPTISENITPHSSCRDIENCRTRWDIIWSCLTTIFLCTWVAIHPNIPEPVDTKGIGTPRRSVHKATCFAQDKLPLFLCAILLPEFILAWALRQRLMVRTIIKENADLQLTTAHGFFIVMGGFHYFKPSGNTENAHEMRTLQLEAPLLNATSNSELIEAAPKPVHPLNHKDITAMVRKKQLILPIEIEIQDRGKSDWLAKIIILTQTLWFVAQCIARGIERLPTTELEVVTLAYIAINFGISIAWWNKPRNVDCPIRVFQEPSEQDITRQSSSLFKIANYILGTSDDLINLHQRRKVPIFYSGKPRSEIGLSNLITLGSAMIFGTVHCIAWSFEFSSSTQALLWRLSSVAITFVPYVILFSFLPILSLKTQNGLRARRLAMLSFSIVLLSITLYVTCRFFTLFIAFMNLSLLPPGALRAVYWTNLIPHV